MWTLRATILALVLATVGTMAYANHENATNLGDEAKNIVFMPGLYLCETLDQVRDAVNNKVVAPTCGQTNMALQGDALIVYIDDKPDGRYIYAQVTFTAQVVGQGMKVPMPPQIHYVLWNVLESLGQGI